MQREDALPIEEWVRAARVYAAERVGWFAPALYAAPLQLADALPHPAAIDRYGRVYFSPRWVAQLYEACGRDRHRLVPQLAQIWYHEVAHWLRAHGERAETLGADAVLWNLAADMEINDYLPEGLAYPSLGDEPLAVLPRQFQLPDGEVAEWYYRQLMERARDQASGQGVSNNRKQAGAAVASSAGIQQHETQAEEGSSSRVQGDSATRKRAGGAVAGSAGSNSRRQAGSSSPKQAGSNSRRKRAGIQQSQAGRQEWQAGGQQQPPPAGSPCEQGEPSDTAPSPRAGRAGEGAEAAATSQSQQQPPSPADSPSEQRGTEGAWFPSRSRGNLKEGARDSEADRDGVEWDEGSGVHGQRRPWELPPNDPNTNALSDFDRQALQEEVARRIVEEHQKHRGTMPAGWLRWAEAILKPKVNWREQLKRIMRGVISEGLGHRLDYSYRRPHRRSAVYHPIYLPALHGEYKPRVACVVDTSGSISDRELAHALTEVRAVLEALRIPITIIPCDAVPYEAIRVFHGSDWLKVREGLRGGGGTDMVAGLNAALSLKPKPEAVIVLTDGHTPFPATRPKDTAVIWAIWQYGDKEPPKPPMPPWRARDVVIIPLSAPQRAR
jgi:predicted metal-dependent peptidase